MLGLGLGLSKISNLLDKSSIFSWFIDTTKTASGSTLSVQYEIPTSSLGTYDFVVNWGDGTSDTINTWDDSNLLHTYSVSGRYTLTIDGVFTHFTTISSKDELKLTDVLSWGGVEITFLDLYGCENFIGSYTDFPKGVLTTFSIDNCSAFNGLVSGFDLSGVTTLFNVFNSDNLFNPSDIGNLNVSTINSLRWAFQNCVSFNTSIDSWNVENVTNLDATFRNTAYNKSLNSWDTSNVTTFLNCFRDSDFNQDISAWTVGGNMTEMFRGNTVFNQNIGAWDISSVTSLTGFANGSSLSQSNYDALLIGWTGWSGGVATKTVPSGLSFSVGTTNFALGGEADAARSWLIVTKLWTITDGGGI